MGKTRVQATVFDLDGTLYLGGAALPGALEAVQQIALQCPVWFLTNNTSRTPQQYVDKLNAMGFSVNISQIVTPLQAVVSTLLSQPYQSVWAFANPSVQAWLATQLPVIHWEPSVEQTELVLLTYHDSFHYTDLCEATWRLQRPQVDYWATHPDTVCPASPGAVPDVGSFIELLASATQRRPSLVLGKPEPSLLQWVAKAQNCSIDQILFVGDRLYTDYELSLRSGCQFALTLTGESTLYHLKAMANPPRVVVESLRQLKDYFCFG